MTSSSVLSGFNSTAHDGRLVEREQIDTADAEEGNLPSDDEQRLAEHRGVRLDGRRPNLPLAQQN